MPNTAAPQVYTWRQFVAASKKNGKGPLYTRYVNRNAAIPFTFLFWKLGLSPNAVSFISSLLTHTGLALLMAFQPTVAICVTVYLFLAIGFVTDCCDGQLARVSGKTSRLGEWLDHSFDAIKSITVPLILGFALIRESIAGDLSLTLAFTATLLNVLSLSTHFFVISLKGMLLGKEEADTMSVEANNWRGRIMRSITYLADYGIYIMTVLLLPWPSLFLKVYLGYGIFYFAFFSAYFLRVLARAR